MATQTQTMKLGVDLRKYPTLARFTVSNAFIRFLIGPAGSLKTSFCFNEILKLACLQQPDAEGVRYTRWVVIRNTFEVLRRATMASCRQNIPEPLLRYTEGNMPQAKGRFLLADGTTVDLQIDFLAVDTVDVLGKLLGYDFTGAFLDEISELPEEVALAAARRAGRYPPPNVAPPTWYGAFGATNGPLTNHWLYKWYKAQSGTSSPDAELEDFLAIRKSIEELTGRTFFELFQQPPALLRPDEFHKDWRPNPLAENVHNLPGGYAYYFNMLAGDDNKIAAYVEGKFSRLVTGKVVFPEFSRKIHVIEHKKIPPLSGHPLLLGADFGLTPAVLLAAETKDGTLVVLDELVGENMSTEALLDSIVIPHITSKYKGSVVGEAWGDPAGMTKGQGTDASPFSVMQSKNIPITIATTNNQLPLRIDAVKAMLGKLGDKGRGKLLISDRCTRLIEALEQTYVYTTGANGQEAPTKSHVNWVSDIVDALQYLCLGVTLRTRKPRTHKSRRKPRGKVV